MAGLGTHGSFLLGLILLLPGPGACRRFSKNAPSNNKWFGSEAVVCPPGLTANETTKMCVFQWFTSGTKTSMFSSEGSKAPLVFIPEGGVYMVESQFASELASAFSCSSLKVKLASFLAIEKMKHNKTFEALYTQKAHEHSKFHTLEENLEPGFFLLEHIAEHGTLEGLLLGFHALEHAAVHGAVIGQATILELFGISVAGGAHVVGGALHFVMSNILPILLPIQMAFAIRHFHHHLAKQHLHAKKFTSHLVMKSDCMVTKLEAHLEHQQALIQQRRKEVSDICTHGSCKAMGEQIQRTTRAKIKIFKLLASVGKCLYPHGDRSWSKTHCVESVYFKLLQSEGKGGILYSAFTLMAYYGFRVDELLAEPFYGKWYEDEFGIKPPTHQVSFLSQLHSVASKPIEDRLPVCMEMLATHRAFERTFERIHSAITVWMQSFSRDIQFSNVRASWWPCQKVFYKIADSDKGMCKHFDWFTSNGQNEHAIDERHACKQAEVYKGSLWPETSSSNNASEANANHSEANASHSDHE